MGRRPSTEVGMLFAKARELVKQGRQVKDACLEVGLNETSYYSRMKQLDKKFALRTRKKTYNPTYWREKKRESRERHQRPVTVTEIQPMASTPTNRLMAVIGSPAEIGEFLRSYA